MLCQRSKKGANDLFTFPLFFFSHDLNSYQPRAWTGLESYVPCKAPDLNVNASNLGLRRVLDVDKSFGINARDGGRTRTPLAGLRILSPVRLPVPPPRLSPLSIALLCLTITFEVCR